MSSTGVNVKHDQRDMIQCHYDVLQVPHHASAEEIKKSYHRLARKNHPDKILQSFAENTKVYDGNQFLRIKAAWETLGDGERRKAYDDRIRRESQRETSGEQLALQVKLSDMEMCEIESSTDENSGQNDDQIKRDLIYTFDCPCGDTFLVSNADLCLDKSNNSNYFDCLSCSHKLCVLIDK